jgi:hypothetical protein
VPYEQGSFERSTHLNNLVVISVVLYNRHTRLSESAYDREFKSAWCELFSESVRLTESLHDTLLVVILSTTGLSSTHQTLQHDLFSAGEEKYESGLTDLGIAVMSIGMFR